MTVFKSSNIDLATAATTSSSNNNNGAMEFVSIEDRFGTSAPKAMSKVMYYE